MTKLTKTIRFQQAWALLLVIGTTYALARVCYTAGEGSSCRYKTAAPEATNFAGMPCSINTATDGDTFVLTQLNAITNGSGFYPAAISSCTVPYNCVSGEDTITTNLTFSLPGAGPYWKAGGLCECDEGGGTGGGGGGSQ